jgi:hypothetical protein
MDVDFALFLSAHSACTVRRHACGSAANGFSTFGSSYQGNMRTPWGGRHDFLNVKIFTARAAEKDTPSSIPAIRVIDSCYPGNRFQLRRNKFPLPG